MKYQNEETIKKRDDELLKGFLTLVGLYTIAAIAVYHFLKFLFT